MLHAKDNIDIYDAYGNADKVYIEGRMLLEEKSTTPTPQDSLWTNLLRKIRTLINDEIKETKITATIKGVTYQTSSDDEGYFHFDIDTKSPLPQGYHDISLQIENNPTPQELKLPIMIEKALGIISDFDDTLIISDVTNKLKLSYNIFTKNHTQRTPVKGMKERFEKLLSQNPTDYPTPLFILTGSPLQLFNSIENFLRYHAFPQAQIIAKKIHGNNTDPLFDQLSYKTTQIEQLFTLFPHMQWILFGDSGEKDAQVYKAIAQKYPHKVHAYYIRDVISGEINETIVK